MNKKFNSLTTIIELHNSPESLQIKKEQGFDAWVVYTIYLAYIRKYKGLDKSSDQYRYFLHDVKTATRSTNERLQAIEKYLIELDIIYITDNKIYHPELFTFIDDLGDIRRNAAKVRWAKAEAMEPKEQNKSDDLPISSSIYQKLNKIKIDGSHSINERDLLAIARAFPEDIINYFIENLPVFKKAMVNVNAKFPFCLGEWKLIDHLKKHWENKLELKKELPAWVNVPESVNTGSIQNNISGESPVKLKAVYLPEGKFKNIYPSWWRGGQFDWRNLAEIFLGGVSTDPRFMKAMFDNITVADWQEAINEWWTGENPKADLGKVYKQRLAKIDIPLHYEIYQDYKLKGKI